ncbi:hypothetical protein NAEGRDRAFT_78141 [Naegleria gruberi]|uniref:RGS domain-containing protein n=1 Tax=Naegleria gruberi TaxID=5762 RepID=D2V1H9_NAEGR|nr:uncharacterized protein NAEGRDRAFT_78141 [Naegleria gruberi]EFC49311.1 hypothetical protein NAEGRDRAFT_78141 [Naegleria gruberi]|eukprot:XP_002682055.1 hypothetical protein NAEGRDRAFT_78141 [Naegleria gruberi strain NEG-M]
MENKQLKKVAILDATSNSVPTIAETKSIISRTNSKTSRTSRFSKTTISTLNVKVKICCGILELDCLRLFSIVSLLINVAAFIIVAGITINMFQISNQPAVRTLIARGDALNTGELLLDIVRVGALSGSNEETKLWYVYRDQMVEALNRIFANIESTTNSTNFNHASKNGSDMYTLPLMEEIIKELENGNYARAKDLYKGQIYQNAIGNWSKQQGSFFGTIKNEGRGKDDKVYDASTTNLAVVGACLAIVLPIVLGMTLINLKRESVVSETLNNSKTMQMLDTIRNPNLSKYFKQACKVQNVEHVFALLQEIITFNTLQNDEAKREQALSIYRNYLKDSIKKQPYKYVSKSLIASICKEIQENYLLHEQESTQLLRFDLFREMEACLCEELVKIHRKFKRNMKM